MWPDWLDDLGKNSKKAYKSSVAAVSKTYDNAVANTKRAISKAADATTKWTVEHKTELLSKAKSFQDVGNRAAKVGTVAVIAGAPIDGVGALPGVVLAGSGNAVAAFGTLLEIGVNYITSGNGKMPQYRVPMKRFILEWVG